MNKWLARGGTRCRAASLASFVAVLMALLLPRSVAAETGEVRFAIGPGLTFLAFAVLEKEKLVEKHVQALGLPPPKVTVNRVSNNDAIRDSVMSGAADIVGTGTPSFLPLWARTHGSGNHIKALTAFNAAPLVLVTRNPDVKTIADFTDKDRIALPGVLNSTQAIILQMQAEKIWGVGNHKKLDHLTISRGHPDALAALLSGASEITAHFAAPPFDRTALASPGIRKVLTSHEAFGGPATNGVTLTTEAFRNANPKTVKAFVEAMKEAMVVINTDRRKSARLYAEATGDKIGEEGLFKILDAPDMVFSVTPNGTLQLAKFMHRIGSIKIEAQTWTDLYFPEIHDQPGS